MCARTRAHEEQVACTCAREATACMHACACRHVHAEPVDAKLGLGFRLGYRV